MLGTKKDICKYLRGHRVSCILEGYPKTNELLT
jgi:hypothetical protein